jgi:signal transduction histidine kinase
MARGITLAEGEGVTRSRAARQRLFPILVLGVLTSALTLVALVYLLQTTTKQRIERAREGVTEEVERVARRPQEIIEPYGSWVVGMRGGLWLDTRSATTAPTTWVTTIESAIAASRGKASGVEVREATLADGTLVVAAEPAHDGGVAWTGVLVRPLPTLKTWQWIVLLLAAATGLLVATSAYAIVTFQRGASSLRGSLAAIARDLDAPVARPVLHELDVVAEGIEGLAESLRRARAEEARLGRELARQERLAALGRVVAGVAHEVRNPLASIKLRLDLAAAAGALPAIASDAIGNASSEIARLDRLVADLLVVAGRAAGPRTRASLGRLVRQRVDALAPWTSERGVTVRVAGDADATVHGDTIARAVDNLLRNAVEASPRGAQVDVVIESQRDVALVRVEDRGEGVPAGRVTELFEPFFTTKAEGTGLGLAITRAIARQHGGDVTYAREAGVTRFALTIGAGAGDGGAASSRPDGASPAPPGRGPQKRERAA